MNSTKVPTPSEQAMSELQMNTLRVSPVVSASLLWDRHLTKGEQRRLGGDFESAYQKFGTVGMWVELRGVTRARAVVEVAKLLGLLNEQNANWLLTEIGEYLDADDEKQAYIDAGHLVLQERPREAFWNGNEIEIDWNSKSVLWDFVWQLARFGKVQAAVERTTFGERADVNVVTKLKSRLGHEEHFPIDLFAAIVVAGRGSQRLKLHPSKIRIFESIYGVEIREWSP